MNIKIQNFITKFKIWLSQIKCRKSNFFDNLPSIKVVIRVFRIWRNKDFISKVDHQDIIKTVLEDGTTSPRYSFMVTISCAIAILGLLLSSPAVVIGAMLLSPLMGPIMLLGFSLSNINVEHMKKALKCIIIGIIMSIAISMFIVTISPITDPTSEIIARTQPNLFDLMVAIFSGLAGGYATIKKKGESIVGVAIATALMPPLAVTGYGVATFNFVIAKGAFFLFMTNLLAICFTVVAIAKWYGFGSHNSLRKSIWQSIIIFIVFIVLSIPLGISLKNIAYQSYVTKTVKKEIQQYFDFANNRFSNFSITFQSNKDIGIDCILITDKYVRGANKVLERRFEKIFNKKITLAFDQIVIAKDEQIQATSSAASNQIQSLKPELTTKKEDISTIIKNTVSFPTESIKINRENSQILIYAQINKDTNLSSLRREEKDIKAKFPEWIILVIPSARTLPNINFDIGSSNISEEEKNKIDNISWILKRWNIYDISVSGYYNNKHREFRKISNYNLTKKRLKVISKIFIDSGIDIEKTSIYGSSDKDWLSKNSGYIEIKLNKHNAS
jgi:uncharacterized hydrophobic protein (TIGR00271 family)